MNKKIYKKIANMYGITAKEVRREMQLAIKNAYENPNAVALTVQKKGVVPTPEEFIAHIADKVLTDS